MATGGRVGFETVAWFNGGLFDDSTVLPLEKTATGAVTAVQIRHGTFTRSTSTSRRPLAESSYVPWSTRWNTPEYESPTCGAPPG